MRTSIVQRNSLSFIVLEVSQEGILDQFNIFTVSLERVVVDVVNFLFPLETRNFPFSIVMEVVFFEFFTTFPLFFIVVISPVHWSSTFDKVSGKDSFIRIFGPLFLLVLLSS